MDSDNKVKLLVVEDSPDVAYFYKVIFEKNTEITVISEADDFLNLIHDWWWKNKDFDVGIFDMMLPTVDGIDILKAARRNIPDLRVIVASANSLSAEQATLYYDIFMLKPFNVPELIEAVNGPK